MDTRSEWVHRRGKIGADSRSFGPLASLARASGAKTHSGRPGSSCTSAMDVLSAVLYIEYRYHKPPMGAR